jgi:hypothetical protein
MPRNFYLLWKEEENNMTASERSQILKMIEDGKISPEEGLRLMQVLEEEPVEDRQGSEAAQPSAPHLDFQTSADPDPVISETVAKARSLWMIPLFIGVVITTFGGWVMYKNIHPSAISAWFYCLGFPIFLLGVLVIIMGVGSKTARWIFVSVKQKPGESPRHIRIGFPLPLTLTSWFLRNFGYKIEGLANIPVDQMIDALQQSSDPLVVNVDEGEDGEKVQVVIG